LKFTVKILLQPKVLISLDYDGINMHNKKCILFFNMQYNIK